MKKGWKDVDRVLYYQELLFVSEIIQIKLIGYYQDDFLVGYFGIKKTRKFISRKYYWSSLRKDVKAYIKECDVCLALKTINQKSYSNLQIRQ